jgi:DNA-nicking Smr family endonuclease
MKKRTQNTQQDEVEILREALAGVTPLPQPNVAHTGAPRPRPVPVQRLRDERAALAESRHGFFDWEDGQGTGEELEFLRPGLPASTLRKLRRGHWAIQDELDLHGHTVAEARDMLAEFLGYCVRRGLRCVRVIHGKGLRSRNREPVLKHKIAGWLMRREEILAFCQARRTEGGSGAVVVLLKGTRAKAEE